MAIVFGPEIHISIPKFGQNSKGGWVADSDGALRCSDCNLFPAADECGDNDDKDDGNNDKDDDNDDIVQMSMVTRKMVMTAMTIL